MRGFKTTRIVVAALTLLANAAFCLFLVLDYIRFSTDVHPEPVHGPAVLSLLGPAALVVLLTALTAIVDLARRHNPAQVTQVRVELSWLGVCIFLQYSAALAFTTLYFFVFKCEAAVQADTCRTVNLVAFVASWAIPFTTLCYFFFFLAVSCRAAKRDPSVWRTPVLAVDWEGTVFDDAKSIASFVNREDAVMTVKTNMLLPPNVFFDEKTRRSSMTKSVARSVDSTYSTDTLVVGRGSPATRTPAPQQSNLSKVRYFQATTSG